MPVESSLASLYEKLKVDDPWLPPRPWESIPSESGLNHRHIASSSSRCPAENRLFDTSTVSEASLVRLALNALQGIESAIISIDKLSAAFCSDPADRSSNRNNGLWNRSSSTHALGNIFKSIGFSGCMVLLLRKFAGYHMNLSLDGPLNVNGHVEGEATGIEGDGNVQAGKEEHLPLGLVNQAFSVAVNKVLEAYICALDTLYASVRLRRSSEVVPMSIDAPQIGSLTSVALSNVTLLEVYLHTKEVRTQIAALGSICNLCDVALGFSRLPFEVLMAKAAMEFANFPRGSDLLSYLHEQLQVADPTHRSLLKFLFVRSCEPYFGLIRSWIFKAEINDPYKEFMMEYAPDLESSSKSETGYLPGASIQVRAGVSVPSFLKDFLVPVIRAGQQLQVLMKLFELCNYVAPGIDTYDDFLPCWKVFSSHTSQLTFSRRHIEELVHERNKYYNKMQEKLEEISAKLEFRYHQVGALGSGNSLFGTLQESLDAAVSFMLHDSPGTALAVDGDRATISSDEASSTCEADLIDSSDWSFSDSDEPIDTKDLISFPKGACCPEEKYLSALKFSRNSLEDHNVDERDQTPHHQNSCFHKSFERPDTLSSIGPSLSDGLISSYVSVNMVSRNPAQSFSVLRHDNTWLEPARFVLGPSTSKTKTTISDDIISHRDMGPFRHSPKDVLTKDEFDRAEKLPISMKLHSSDYRDFNFLSKNPMLSVKTFIHSVSTGGTGLCSAYGKSLPCFQFSSVEDAVRICVEKLDGGCTPELERQTLWKGNSDKILMENTVVQPARIHTDVELSSRPVTQGNISGGSSWESLRGTLREPAGKAATLQGGTSSDTFETPLDFIIDKCLLQEIWLQYKYISKLTIKLLDDGFDLQEHLLTLRRYHLMEVADWADLFIMSLSHHKSRGLLIEAEQRASDIQGILEASIQRSSCENDNYKDRLFVYFEEHDMVPLSTSATGIHAFDFLRLGYRVNWPVSIILTPSALKIYAEIFNFLIKVKLAIFSLTDSWCLLKDSMHQNDLHGDSQLQGLEPRHVKTLINTRHQLNHFISMLQQYVQSQLSHVSWSRFRQSLKHKVKDMMDLETVHMEFLTDSLHACFLSEETQAVGSIIKNVLQYTLDFQGCLVRSVHDTGARADILDKVRKIRLKFDEHMEELQRIYLRSPKHGKFGVSHFWGFLNYNDFYSSQSNQGAFFF